MKKYLFIALFIFALIPGITFAWTPGASIIPCTGAPSAGTMGPPGPAQHECTFSDLIVLGANIVDALFIFSVPVVALVFAYAGYLYLTAMGNSGQVEQAKKIFTKVMIGFVVMLSAWLLVKFIQDQLLSSKITIPDEVKLK